MTVNLSVVKNNPKNSVVNTESPHASTNIQTQTQNPSFGIKPIELNEGSKVIKFFTDIDDNFDSAWQRLVSGVTAVFTQPFFDLNNKDADEETRKTSCARTISKIAVGTATGVAIRALCIKLIGAFTKNEDTEKHLKEAGKKFKTIEELNSKPIYKFLLTEEAFKKATYREIKKYRGALGTFAALGIMLFTNFLIDAPLTMKMTNMLTAKNKEGGEK